MTELRVVRRLGPLVRRHALAMGVLVVVGAVAALTESVGIGLFIPLLHGIGGAVDGAGGRLGRLFDLPFAGMSEHQRLSAIVGLLAVALVGRTLLTFVHGALLARLTSRLAHELRTRLFRQLLAVELRWVERHDAGTLLHALETQTWQAAAAVGTLVGIASRLCKVALLGAVLLCISWRLTLLVALALAVVSLATWLVARGVETLAHAQERSWSVMAQRMVETLRVMRTVRALGQERFEEARFGAASGTECGTFERLQMLQASVPAVSELLVAGLMLAVLSVTLEGPGQLPEVLTFLVILYRIHPQIQQLDGGRVALVGAAPAVEAVTALLDVRDKPYVRSGWRPFRTLGLGITLCDVGFCYHDDGAAALEDVDLFLPARGTTAIVGPSGAGKSTLIRLLLRLADPTRGRIEVDGVPLDELDLDAWRARVAVVSQDVQLLDGTIAENVAYGSPGGATLEEIRAAAVAADAAAFIEALPDGYQTRVGDDGLRLSGGQRQRLALARALVRRPEVLILDEATSAVDAISAAFIARTLAELGGRCTVVVVTHRLAAVEDADQVVLLDHGRVEAVGRAADLRARSMLFARLSEAVPRHAAGGGAG